MYNKTISNYGNMGYLRSEMQTTYEYVMLRRTDMRYDGEYTNEAMADVFHEITDQYGEWCEWLEAEIIKCLEHFNVNTASRAIQALRSYRDYFYGQPSLWHPSRVNDTSEEMLQCE